MQAWNKMVDKIDKFPKNNLMGDSNKRPKLFHRAIIK